MITFKKVRFKNFLSTGNNFTEINLNEYKSTLIVGQNGAGKSTMLDAISFGLFGKPHRNINKPQLVNSINQKQAVVEVEFSVNSNHFKVVRGVKPNKFEIWKGDTMINQSSHSKEYQKILEQNILKLNHKTFHQVVVLGSSSFIPFMQLASHSRRDVIEDLLDINVFSKMNQILKEKSATLKEDIRENDFQIEINSTKLESQKKYIRDISKINADVKKEKEDIIERWQKEKDTHVNAVVDLNAKVLENSKGLSEGLTETKNIVLELQSSDTEIKTKIKALVKETKFYENNETCPTCDQNIDEDLKKGKVKQASITAAEFQSRLAEIAESQSKATTELAAYEARLAQNNDWQNEIKQHNDFINKCDAEIKLAENDINNLSNDKSDLAKANADFEEYKNLLDNLREQKLKLNEQFQYNQVVLELLKDTGIKTKIIKQYVPVINNFVNQYLQILDFFVHFELDETFTETIKSRHRDAFSYDSFSEGEKQRIDLSLLFTWRQVAKMKNSVATNLLILDETFDSSLDQDGVENLMKILYTLSDDTNVFVISHKGDMLEGKFNNKLEFVKDKNFSKIKK
jgi:DNA repair exonuclease SbcCD ATPase subunit